MNRNKCKFCNKPVLNNFTINEETNEAYHNYCFKLNENRLKKQTELNPPKSNKPKKKKSSNSYFENIERNNQLKNLIKYRNNDELLEKEDLEKTIYTLNQNYYDELDIEY